MTMLVKSLNPVYVYALAADLIAAAVGLGLIFLSDLQMDLILKVVAGVIALTTGVAIPAAKENDARITKAFYTNPRPDEVIRL
jgi:uncharacterized membrane protein